jgi:hypothetical protein
VTTRNPIERPTETRNEFGEHGGVNMSNEASATLSERKERFRV